MACELNAVIVAPVQFGVRRQPLTLTAGVLCLLGWKPHRVFHSAAVPRPRVSVGLGVASQGARKWALVHLVG